GAGGEEAHAPTAQRARHEQREVLGASSGWRIGGDAQLRLAGGGEQAGSGLALVPLRKRGHRTAHQRTDSRRRARKARRLLGRRTHVAEDHVLDQIGRVTSPERLLPSTTVTEAG